MEKGGLKAMLGNEDAHSSEMKKNTGNDMSCPCISESMS